MMIKSQKRQPRCKKMAIAKMMSKSLSKMTTNHGKKGFKIINNILKKLTSSRIRRIKSRPDLLGLRLCLFKTKEGKRLA